MPVPFIVIVLSLITRVSVNMILLVRVISLTFSSAIAAFNSAKLLTGVGAAFTGTATIGKIIAIVSKMLIIFLIVPPKYKFI